MFFSCIFLDDRFGFLLGRFLYLGFGFFLDSFGDVFDHAALRFRIDGGLSGKG